MTRVPWWLWSIATFVILTFWMFAAAVVTGTLTAIGPSGVGWFDLLTELATFVPFALATLFAWRVLLRRPLRSLITNRRHIEFNRIGRGFATWFGLCAASSVIDAVLFPDSYTLTFEAGRFVAFALVLLVLLPVQTSSEELFFRGWILQWAAALPAVSRVFISGLVFALPHAGNPEAATDTLLALTAYFLLGAGWAWVSVRDGGIELALGAHLANNAFSLLVVGYDDAALPTAAIFGTSALNLTSTTIAIAVMVPMFARLTRRKH